MPKGRPADKAWHVVRESLVKDIYKGLSIGDGPRLVGLVGRSGSGKTTCAAAVVGDPAVGKLCRAEKQDQALKTLNLVRTHFCDGVIWLPVGRGAGSPLHLPGIMNRLATMVHEDILGCRGYRPGASPHIPLDGSAYIHEAMRTAKDDGEKMRCLVVADDVWESPVLEELQRTGMSVLFTTRNEELVHLAEGTVVVVDQLTEAEAEFVLRSAAELSARALFPAAAKHVLDRCDRVAMHLEFVGRWNNVRGSEEDEGWTEAVEAIDAEAEAVQNENAEGRAEDSDSFEDRRVAILRAGFRYLAALNEDNRSLYLALAVLPDGHAFATKEAAVLLFDSWDSEHKVKKAAKVVGVLEQWAVVRMEGSLYRMHDAHVKFARSKLTHVHSADVHEPVAQRWRDHISSLDALVSVDNQTLRELWGALQSAGGDGWHALDPYDTALAALGDTDPLCFESLIAVVSFYCSESEWARIDQPATRLLRLQESREDTEGVKRALEMLIHSANGTERLKDGDRYRGLMSSMLDKETTEDFDPVRHGARHVIRALTKRGEWLGMTRRFTEARETLQRALDIQRQNPESVDKLEAAGTFESLAEVLNNLCLTEEAAEVYQQSLTIMEEDLGQNNLGLTVTMHNLAVTLFDLERMDEAADLFQRSLGISEARGPDNMSMYHTMMRLARCCDVLNREQEAADLLERARRVSERSAKPASST